MAGEIDGSDSLEIFLKELAAVCKEDIPIGAERTLRLNVTDGLDIVGRGGIAIRKLPPIPYKLLPPPYERVHICTV